MALNDELRQFVTDNFMYGKPCEGFADDDSFIQRGIIDSTAVMELIAFLEKRYAIKLQDQDLVPENLDSVNGLARLVKSRLPPSYASDCDAGRAIPGFKRRLIAGRNILGL